MRDRSHAVRGLELATERLLAAGDDPVRIGEALDQRSRMIEALNRDTMLEFAERIRNAFEAGEEKSKELAGLKQRVSHEWSRLEQIRRFDLQG